VPASSQKVPEQHADHGKKQPYQQTDSVDEHKIVPIACMDEVKTCHYAEASRNLYFNRRHANKKHHFQTSVIYNFDRNLELETWCLVCQA
jgi:hypothetical protein